MTDITQTKRSKKRTYFNRSMAVVLALLVPAIVMGGLYKWRETRNQRPKFQVKPLPVAATVAKPCEVQRFIRSVGSLRAVQEVTLSPEVSGRVTEILFKAGTRVAKGDLLVRLYDEPLLARRKAVRVKLAFAKMQLERSQKLAPSGAESRSLLDRRRSERDQAAADLQQINAELAQKQVRSPFAGQLGICRINPGQYLNPGDAIASLTALDSLYIDFTVPQQDFGRLCPGAEVSIFVDAWPGQVFTAHVNVVEPRIDEDTRNVMLEAQLFNPEEKLRSGMHANVHLNLLPRENALVVPRTAVMTSAMGNSIMVVHGETPGVSGRVKQVAVTTGRQIGDNVVIKSGLAPGDVFITEGQVRVRPGAQVKVASLAGTKG